MKKITIKAISPAQFPGGYDPDQGTPCEVSVEGSTFSCKALCLPDRDNAPDLSRIPFSDYPASMSGTNNPALLPECYLLQNTEPRQAILIHNGNYAGDVKKGFKSDVEGCFVLGDNFGMLDPGDGFNGPQLAVLNSRATVESFNSAVFGLPIMVSFQSAP